MVQKAETIWFDGELVPWDEAKVHVLTHTLHYGMGVFEGIRCYTCTDGGSAVFRLREHVRRLFDSAKINEMAVPFTEAQICDAIVETLKANRLAEGYIRPLCIIGAGAMGVYPADNPVQTIIAVWPWGAYLGAEALEKGIRVKTSTFTRHHVNVMMTKAKTCGNYVNSILAKREAVAEGYNEALMLDTEGYVCEATGENIFIVRDGVIKTPPPGAILAGITRESVMLLAEDLGYTVVEERFTRDALYSADEAFFTGTAAEITPIREVDRRVIGAGKRGPVTAALQDAYFKVLRGENPKYGAWLTRYSF
ncbi:MAG: branched-chain amino acid aminotransferase [Desulfomicrobiaceae bacterium]|jgi:branched-chain amino acid aminotransferase|nr:branched-chain amino acid transaminase [Desulfomicrobiaceae bacterium]MBZ4685002.1 branched-chain amino acid aminotransferase [Desulfomicrobiaceae bacterium]MDI3492832.1 branched-chain amino acid aminotransferase [Desulfomicrobiaceae bacterium]MDK2873635.1 branched-chain amino acid aminotransferase [Desulfomicrobiaceae bacterium]